MSFGACRKEDSRGSAATPADASAPDEATDARELQEERNDGELRQQQAPGAVPESEDAPLEEAEAFPDAPMQGGMRDPSAGAGRSREGDASKSAPSRTEKKGANLADPMDRPATPKSKSETAKPSAPRGSGGAEAISDPDGLLTRLGSLESQLRSAGVRLPQDPAGAAAGDDKDANEARDCAQVCELAEAICDLEVRICAMASAHPEDDRYDAACSRAGGDCRAASRACNDCD